MADSFDFQATFGSTSSCVCEECRSIYGAPAYLVDILLFLQPAGRAVLFGAKKVRRPDLGEIELSCQNTDTPLPCLDLVNEALEYGVWVQQQPQQNTPPPPPGGWPQTLGTADALAASPEHRIDAVYAAPTNAVPKTLLSERYPWALPFDLGAADARAHLELVQVRRHDLMRTFQDKAKRAPSDVAIGIEALGLSPAEARVVTARQSVRDVRLATTKPIALSGLTLDGLTLAPGDRVLVKDQAQGGDPRNGIYVAQANAWSRADDALDLTDGLFVRVGDGPQKGTAWVLTTRDPIAVDKDKLVFEPFGTPGALDGKIVDRWRAWFPADPGNGWTSIATNVGALLDRSSMAYQELVDALHARYVNRDPKNPIEIVFADDDTCDLAQATFHDSKGAVTLDDAFLSRLHRFVRLRRALGWTAHELDQATVALGAPDLTDAFLLDLSLVARLRDELGVGLETALAWWSPLDTSLGEDGEPSFFEQVFVDPSAPAAPLFTLKADRTDLVDATKAIADNVPAVIAGLEATAADLALLLPALDGKLNLSNLSALYRSVTLARALGLTVAQLLSLEALSGLAPFASPAATWTFATTARKVQASAFSLAELDWLLRDVTRDGDGIAPTDDTLDRLLSELWVGLAKIETDTQPPDDPTGEILRAKLDALFPLPADKHKVAEAMAFLADPSGTNDPTQFVKDHFSDFIATDAAVKTAVQAIAQATTFAGRVAAILAPYQEWVRATSSSSFVVRKLAEELGAGVGVVGPLVTLGLRSARQVQQPPLALAEFTDPSFVKTGRRRTRRGARCGGSGRRRSSSRGSP
jgi:hypothetical protein